jgi:quinol-cytochrome oxidoreductase complex cytochrome b subunit
MLLLCSIQLLIVMIIEAYIISVHKRQDKNIHEMYSMIDDNDQSEKLKAYLTRSRVIFVHHFIFLAAQIFQLIIVWDAVS